VYLVLAVLGIAAVGGGYETVRESLDARDYPMPVQLIDVGGHRLHLHCTGSGSPRSFWNRVTGRPQPAPI
jgi:hypothetical protein